MVGKICEEEVEEEVDPLFPSVRLYLPFHFYPYFIRSYSVGIRTDYRLSGKGIEVISVPVIFPSYYLL